MNTGKHNALSVEPSSQEISSFFDNLAENEHRVALLSTSAEYAERFETTSCTEPSLPPLLSSFVTTEYHRLSQQDKQKQCEEIFKSLKISCSEAQYLEQITRKQSGCLEWFDHRVGRITASVTYAVLGTNPDNHSKSLVNRICSTVYNGSGSAASLIWGKQHESEARKAYEEMQQGSHRDFHCYLSGLVINPKYPHMGASPDGRVDCTCCGRGVLEINAPINTASLRLRR